MDVWIVLYFKASDIIIVIASELDLSVCLSSYHPHHEVGEDGDPQGGGHKGDHEPAVPAWQNTVRHSAVEQEAQRPRDDPLHPGTAAACGEQEVDEEGTCSTQIIRCFKNFCQTRDKLLHLLSYVKALTKHII